MTISPQALGVAIALPLILFMLYRRFRRNFGHQPVQPKRMITRVVLLAVIGTMVLGGSLHDSMVLAAGAGGLAAGVALGYWGLRLTRFERHADGLHYIPHSYFGIGITALLVGRLAYRFLVVMPTMHAAAHAPMPQSPLGAYQKSPLTLALFGLLIGYYIAYYIGVLVVARRQVPTASADTPT